MNITSEDFVVAHAGTQAEMYNAKYTLNEYTMSLSYGGMCYGSGFWSKSDEQFGGSFEVCVWNTRTGDTMLTEDGQEVRGWMSLDAVYQLVQQILDGDG